MTALGSFAVSDGEAAYGAAIDIFRAMSPDYSRANTLTHSDPDYVDPGQLIEMAARAACAAAGAANAEERGAFWARVGADETAPGPALAAAAQFALDAGEPEVARQRATRGLALMPGDLHLQAILIRAKGGSLRDADLAKRFCPAPFQNLETAPGEEVYFCCPAWLPKPVGNLSDASADDIWNSPAAQDIRASIHDGSYRYCSRIHCPKLSGGTLEPKTAIGNAAMRRISDARETRIAVRPAKIVLSHDRSCNLSCPSCRTGLILARKEEQKRLNDMAARVIFPLLEDAERVRITASGDAFGSAHFQWVMRNLDRVDNARLRLDLQTNGVLLTPRLWDALALEGRVDRLIVSVDATEPDTYAIVRRGGDFATLMDNLDFMAGLRAEGRIGAFRLDFVVQALNFRQMPDFVALARRLRCDGVKFQMIRSWGTYTPQEFATHDIARPDHPEHVAFLSVLAHPDLAARDVELWGMADAVNAARTAAAPSA